MRNKRKSAGFTLIELMVTIVIVGILGIVALPAYKKYVTKSKLAEAYSLLGTMEKNQITYYNEYGNFYNIYSNVNLVEGMTIVSDPAWSQLGYPAPVGSKTWFGYNTLAGKTSPSGTYYALGNPDPSGNTNFVSPGAGHGIMIAFQGPSSIQCNNPGSAASLGVSTTEVNYDWALIIAVGNLDDQITNECTCVVREIESKTSTGKRPGSPRGFLLFNYGK